MNVFMLSLDRALLGEGGGDAVARHREYGKRCERLIIIVPTPPGRAHAQMAENVEVYPTNAGSWLGHARAILGYFRSIRRHTRVDLIVAQDLLSPLAWLLAKFRSPWDDFFGPGTRSFGSVRGKGHLQHQTPPPRSEASGFYYWGPPSKIAHDSLHYPLIVNVHGVWWDEWFRRKRWWHRLYLPCMAWVMKRADAARVVSRELKEVLVNMGVPRDRIYVIPTPVDVRRFAVDARHPPFQTRSLSPAGSFTQSFGESRPSDTAPDLPRNGLESGRLAQGEKEQVVLSVGRLEREKGFDALLRVWERVVKEIPTARLFIIGDGSERQNLQQLAQELKIAESVHFLGAIPSTDLPSYYHQASVFVLASHSESFGKVLVEAGASRLPVVATATLGARSIVVQGKTGWLVPIHDVNTFVAKVTFLLKNSEEALNMGTNAYEHVIKTFDYEKNVERVIKLWRQIVKETSPASP